MSLSNKIALVGVLVAIITLFYTIAQYISSKQSSSVNINQNIKRNSGQIFNNSGDVNLEIKNNNDLSIDKVVVTQPSRSSIISTTRGVEGEKRNHPNDRITFTTFIEVTNTNSQSVILEEISDVFSKKISSQVTFNFLGLMIQNYKGYIIGPMDSQTNPKPNYIYLPLVIPKDSEKTCMIEFQYIHNAEKPKKAFKIMENYIKNQGFDIEAKIRGIAPPFKITAYLPEEKDPYSLRKKEKVK